MTEYERVLKALVQGLPSAESLLRILDTELSLPNIPTPTLGGEVLWNTIAEYNGWKVQQNMITHHARILNSDHVRIAWGTINGMMKALDRMAACLHQYEEDPSDASQRRRSAMDELKSLKELLDLGAITESEYRAKKAKLMDQI